jgi:hypothetical protein
MIDGFDAVVESSSESFDELVSIAGLSPEADFIGTDLSDVDFGTADLRGFVFRGANLDGANLSRTLVTARTLDGASLIGSKLPKAAAQQKHWVTIYLSPSTKQSLVETFGSTKQAVLSALSAGSYSGVPETVRLILYLLDSRDHHPIRTSGDSRTTIMLETPSYAWLSELAAQIGIPRSYTLKFLLEIVEAIYLHPRGAVAQKLQQMPGFEGALAIFDARLSRRLSPN